MKQLLRMFIVLAVTGLLGASSLRAQNTEIKPAIAFVKADRSQLFIKKTDSAAKVVLEAHAPYITAIQHLAILGQTPGGGTFVLAGAFTYLDAGSSTQVTYNGIVAVPSDFDPSNPFSLTKIKFLKASPYGGDALRPVGTVSRDGKEWFTCFISSAPGSLALRFYHGNVDGTGVVDSATLTGPFNSNAIFGGFHISNLALSPDNSTMIAVSVDNLEDPKGERYQLYRWNVKQFGGPEFHVSGDFAGAVKGLRPSTANLDSLFGLTVRVEDDTWADLGLTNIQQLDNSIAFYRIRYNSIGNISLNDPQVTIPRDVIPSTMNFFAGGNTSVYRETVSEAAQLGAGGDMNFNAAGDQVIFVTHEAPDNVTNRNAQSAIYSYKLGDATATLLYNDPAAQELQPIFIDAVYAIPPAVHYPAISLSINSFGTVFTDANATQTLTIHNDSLIPVTIKSATITGANASQFTLVTDPTGQTIAPGASTTASVKFTPTGLAGPRSATLTVVFNSDSSKSITLTGSAAVKDPGAVREDEALALNLSMQPNPFTTSLAVRLTAPEAGTLGIVVHDALGHTVYTSDVRHVASGSVESFDFNPKSLGLANGVYYVSAIFGDRQISRQAIYLK